jgi:DNA-binding IclR family transcriptional regulator
MESTAARYRIDVVYRATRVLLAFREAPHAFGVAELARRTGATKGSCFRIAKTLQEAGFLEVDATGRYRIGLLLYELAHAAGRPADIVSLAQDLIDALRERTRETVNLLVRDGWGGVCVAQREGPQAVKVSAQLGRRWGALHAGACPKAMLAFMPPEEVDAYIREHGLTPITEATIVDEPTLRRVLAQIRAEGYSRSDEDTDVGVQAVGAPIFDRSARPVAAVSVTGPLHRFTPERMAEFAAAVREVGATVSRRLGYLGPYTP